LQFSDYRPILAKRQRCRILRREVASTTPERVIAAGHPIDVTRIKITDAGRAALEQH
jgi:hypothetical protein